MYLRLTKVRRGTRTYRYAQLVEAYRRADGKPTNRVIANLGALDDVQVANIRAALEASREGTVLSLAARAAEALPRAIVAANLRFLDLAVLLRLWRELKLDEIVAGCLPVGDRTASPADVVAALVLQRCVAPASKLAAERWYPTTALPELLGVPPAQFNNSRIHRVLEELEQTEGEIQARLAPAVEAWDGGFRALFIDATDTWFVGEGPPLAQKGRDKEGIYRRRVGLVLLCDQRGFPLRWQTLSGRYHDGTALLDMAQEVAALPWIRGVPVALDRAVGHAGGTETLDAAGLRYVTALPDAELSSSGVPIPWPVVMEVQSEKSTTAMEARLRAGGFAADGRGRWILDLGVFDKTHSAGARKASITSAALASLEAIESEKSLKAAAMRSGVSVRTLNRHTPLRGLAPDVRAHLRAVDTDRLGLADLTAVALAPAPEQRALLERLLLASADREKRSARKRQPSTYRARAVLCVSPERILADRQADEERVAEVERAVVDMNRRLAHRSNRRTDASALAAVQRVIRHGGLGSVLQPTVTGAGADRRIALEKDEEAWSRRRQGDGINVVVSHPDVAGGGSDLIALYFAKDQIERDFRIIKSLVELRPVHHRTDPKVRAHVTICILALFLLRALEQRLRPHGISAAAALESFEPTRLNLLTQDDASFYTVTRPDPAVSAILKHLGLSQLVDDRKVASQITPR